jgi:hypothetical protein
LSNVLTQSELASFLRCKRRWWLGYYRSLRKVHDTPRLPTVGTLVHAGLEAYYRGAAVHPIDVVKERAVEMITEAGDFPGAAETIQDAAGLAGIMLEGYLDWVQETGADVGLDVYAAEQMVEVTLSPTPYRLRGKIDARARRAFDGAQVQLEHKTVGSLTDLPKTAQSSFQFLTYDLLAYLKSLEDADTTYRTDGVLLNMLKRVKRTARAKPPFYGREVVRHNTHELRSHWKHVVAIAREMDAVRARLEAGEDHHSVVPPTWTRDCTWSCPFYAVCPMFDDGSDAEDMLETEYETYDPLARYADDGHTDDAA